MFGGDALLLQPPKTAAASNAKVTGLTIFI
jgi:hypothetical protein